MDSGQCFVCITERALLRIRAGSRANRKPTTNIVEADFEIVIIIIIIIFILKQKKVN